ncbi:TRAP transporter large permease subunit [Pseudomonas sp. CrR25]|nr:TRAP transporter large permease subunit [Pseudomonas sp. CrR25]
MTIVVFLGSLLGAMAMRIPVAFALMLAGVALMIQLDSFDAQILAQNLISGADSFPLLAIPFFMLAGELMNAGGLSRRIVALPMALLGHKRGGLGFVAIIATVVMASLSGSAVADTAAVAAMLMPMMRKAGYQPNRSAGLIAAGGIIAPIIPPSIPLVVFGVAGGVSITKLFLAGVAPGLMMGLGLWLCWWWLSRNSDYQCAERASWREVRAAFFDGLWALVLPVLIIGGLKLGVFTPTEAAAVAAAYALFVALFIYRELKPRDLFKVFLDAGKTSSVVMFLVAAALVSSWLMTIAELPLLVSDLLAPLVDRPQLLLVAIMLIVLLVGMSMDLMPIVLILTPVFMPVIKLAGIDPVYFGILFIMNASIGLITPPVGNVLSVMSGVSKVPLDGVMRGVLPFLAMHLLVLSLLIVFPALVMTPLRWLMP